MTHNTSTIKRKVQAAIGDLYEVILDLLSLWKLRRIHELVRAEVFRPLLFSRVGVDGDDARCADG